MQYKQCNVMNEMRSLQYNENNIIVQYNDNAINSYCSWAQSCDFFKIWKHFASDPCYSFFNFALYKWKAFYFQLTTRSYILHFKEGIYLNLTIILFQVNWICRTMTNFWGHLLILLKSQNLGQFLTFRPNFLHFSLKQPLVY